MNKSLSVIFTTVVLDAVGIGLIFPILPALIRSVTHVSDVARWIGALTALYAAMQFVFAPMVGALSDRFGRRPVLLVSLAGATIDYLFLAFAPTLWMLFVGRAIAGLTSANMAVAQACLADITPEEQRTHRFGLFNAMFGIGFVIGPVLGGLLGDHWLRLPFILAAALNGCNFLLALLALPETRAPTHQSFDPGAFNPLRPLRWLSSMKHLLPVISVFFLLSATGEAYGVCWALWGSAAFHWNGLAIGLSLGVYGICQALAQAFLPGRAVKALGERAAILIGIAGACIALLAMAFATQGWMAYAIMPVLVLGGIGVPALQSFATRQVSESQQGQLQGVIASTISLASVVAPLLFAALYFIWQQHWPGAVWLSVIALYVLAVPAILGLEFSRNA
ncbi:MAG: TCR/Tet family MFS transporter [Proteobacteria bacterium]|nr:TCR/Tet family MFS transporter [Pseudomonadota bacterium]